MEGLLESSLCHQGLIVPSGADTFSSFMDGRLLAVLPSHMNFNDTADTSNKASVSLKRKKIIFTHVFILASEIVVSLDRHFIPNGVLSC